MKIGETLKIIDVSKYEAVLQKEYIKHHGRVSQVVGLTIESLGPAASIGDACLLRVQKHSEPILAEVVGFKENKILLMPLGDMGGDRPRKYCRGPKTATKCNCRGGAIGTCC